MSSHSLLILIDRVLVEIHLHDQLDSITECPTSLLTLLSSRPGALVKLAHFKIHSFPFSKVQICWRRLFTDASIGEAVSILRDHLNDQASVGGKPRGNDHMPLVTVDVKCDWLQEVVRILDMAVIIAGAPKREQLIEEIFAALQDSMPKREEEEPPRKRLKRKDIFSTNVTDEPCITKPVRKQNAMSMEQFEAYLPNAQPLVMLNAFLHWPACHERPWSSPAYLMEKTLGGRRLVPVELGRSYIDVGWGQSIMTFKEFMDRYLLCKTTDGDPNKIGYVAQHDLFSQIPALRNDISIPDYCYTEPPQPAQGTPLFSLYENENMKLEEPALNAWFGPAGTVSPLHTDPYHNILCQVVGKKYVRLYSPAETSKLYSTSTTRGDGLDMSNTSQVDVEGDQIAIDQAFPLFKSAPYIDTVLQEGECLYIPVGWWHYIRSLTVSFSVSFWWN